MNINESIKSYCLRLTHFKNSILERYASKISWLILMIFSMLLFFSTLGVLIFFSGELQFLGVVLTLFSCLCLGVFIYSFMKFLSLSFVDKKISDWVKKNQSIHERIKNYLINKSTPPLLQDLLSKSFYMNSLSLKSHDKRDLYSYFSAQQHSDKEVLRNSPEFVMWEMKIRNYLLASEDFIIPFFSGFSKTMSNPHSNRPALIRQLVYLLHYPFTYFLMRTKAFKPLINDGLGFKIPDDSAEWIIPKQDNIERFYDPVYPEYWHRMKYNTICHEALRVVQETARFLPDPVVSKITSYYKFDLENEYPKSFSIEDPERFCNWYELEGQFLLKEANK